MASIKPIRETNLGSVSRGILTTSYPLIEDEGHLAYCNNVLWGTVLSVAFY